MTDRSIAAERIFTDADWLQLLQLSARRAMEFRRAHERGGTDEDAAVNADAWKIAIPERWRLVPESVELYDWQRECLPLWLAKGRGTVKVATGGGKTRFALAAAQELQNKQEPNLRLVVVVPTIPLMFQWRDEMLAGNLPLHAIGLLGGGQDLAPLSEIRVLICVLNSARERLSSLVREADWPLRMMLIVDECHRTAASQARRIFDSNPRYTLGLSATPESDVEAGPSDSAYEDGVVGKVVGPIIYEFSLEQSQKAGLLTPFEVWHVALPLAPDESNQHGKLSREIGDLRKPLQSRHRRSRSKQGFIAWVQTQASRGGADAADAERFLGLSNQRKRLLYKARARSDVVLGALSEAAADPESRAIVFHEAVDQVESLFLGALDRGIAAVLEHGSLPDRLRNEGIEAFRRGIAQVIISARSLIEGFNVPAADLGIIAASSSSVRQRIQSLGRMLRRKQGGRNARVLVLYVRDTEDEAIYDKADWEKVLGAETNRYFEWNPTEDRSTWPEALEETGSPPRTYKSPSWDVDVATLSRGDPYPAQTRGVDTQVDTSGNLRTQDGQLLSAERSLVEAVIERSPKYRRARITPAGHLIVRMEGRRDGDADWRFLGQLDLPVADDQPPKALGLRVKTVSGKRRIVRLEFGRQRLERFATGPGVDALLEWLGQEESRRGVPIQDVYWDGDRKYWLEVQGERVEPNSGIAPLSFDR